jgi:hypothetical protein
MTLPWLLALFCFKPAKLIRGGSYFLGRSIPSSPSRVTTLTMTTVHETPPSNISLGDMTVNTDNVLTLQEQSYKITAEQAKFFKQQTGITDDDELKRHILAVQAEAYKV